MILSRYKRERDKIKKKLNKINAKELFGFEKITCYTLHESKGMQADNVIILNVNQGAIPSTVADEKLLCFVSFNDSEDQRENLRDNEERRLFYVGLTRTKNKVFLCSKDTVNGGSIFFKDLPTSKKSVHIEFFNHDPKFDPFIIDSKSIIRKFWKYKQLIKETDCKCPNCDGHLNFYEMNNSYLIVCSEHDNGCEFFIDDVINKCVTNFNIGECECGGINYYNTLFNYTNKVEKLCTNEKPDIFLKKDSISYSRQTTLFEG